MICVGSKQQYFFEEGWTAQIALIPRENFFSRRMREAPAGTRWHALTTVRASLRFGAEQDRNGVAKLEGLHHILSGDLVLLEMAMIPLLTDQPQRVKLPERESL